MDTREALDLVRADLGNNIVDESSDLRDDVSGGECHVCGSDEDMVEFVKREHAKGAIDRAGATLVPWWKDPIAPGTDEIADAYAVVQNWRTSHALPLNVFNVLLRSRAKRVEIDVLIAQRLKRFSSLINKLVRQPTMKLSQMQDLGGCRAILSNIEAVDKLVRLQHI